MPVPAVPLSAMNMENAFALKVVSFRSAFARELHNRSAYMQMKEANAEHCLDMETGDTRLLFQRSRELPERLRRWPRVRWRSPNRRSWNDWRYALCSHARDEAAELNTGERARWKNVLSKASPGSWAVRRRARPRRGSSRCGRRYLHGFSRHGQRECFLVSTLLSMRHHFSTILGAWRPCPIGMGACLRSGVQRRPRAAVCEEKS